jgi:hypothetical protein
MLKIFAFSVSCKVVYFLCNLSSRQWASLPETTLVYGCLKVKEKELDQNVIYEIFILMEWISNSTSLKFVKKVALPHFNNFHAVVSVDIIGQWRKHTLSKSEPGTSALDLTASPL